MSRSYRHRMGTVRTAYPYPVPDRPLPAVRRSLFSLQPDRLGVRGSELDSNALDQLKDRYWAKSIKGKKLRKAIKAFLFFIGTAGLNAFTQEKILGSHQDNKLSESCIKLISVGAGMPLGWLIPMMGFFAVCTCITNVIARARALGSDNEGFEVVKRSLTDKQRQGFHRIDKAFQTLILFPNGENVFYISEEDKQSFGPHFQSIMDLMYAKYAKFRVTTDWDVIDKALSTSYKSDASASVPSPESPDRFNVILYNDERYSRRTLFTESCRIIPITVPLPASARILNQSFHWTHLRQKIKRVVWDVGLSGNLYRLWRVFLWITIKGFPAFQVILQLSKALYSLEEAIGLSDDTHWAIQLTCLAFNLTVAFNRAFINNEMKGNEVYGLMEKWAVHKKYNLPKEKTKRWPLIWAVLLSAIPIFVTILYFVFTSLFFAREGPISLGKQINGIFPKSWVHAITPAPGFTNFLLNFITYGAVLTGVVLGVLTQCRAIYIELYKKFSTRGTNSDPSNESSSEEDSAGFRSCCAWITKGIVIFYVAVIVDSTLFGLNAFYNSMQAMLNPKHFFITEALGACKFALVLPVLVGIGITLTSLSWSKFTGDEKYKSFTRLFVKDTPAEELPLRSVVIEARLQSPQPG